MKKLFIAFDQYGLHGLHIGAKNRKEALKYAKELWGKGAKIELYRKPKLKKVI